MRRVQWVELEDLAWVPAAVRNGGTDLLDLLFGAIGFYRPLVDVFQRAVEAEGSSQVIDLCSGGGGGALFMSRELQRRGLRVQMTLTDLHPNEAAHARVTAAGLKYHATSVDAARVPAELKGLRTMFSALHHFRPEAIQALLGDAVASRTHLALLDVAAHPKLRRLPLALAPLAMIPNTIVLAVLGLFLMPFVRPLRASNWLLTYVLPLIPLLFAWDGSVSAVRAYAPDELLELARSVPGSDTYAWEAGRGGNALYLIGRPKS